MENEILVWSEQYARAVEAHGRALGAGAVRVRAGYRRRAEQQRRELQQRAAHAMEAVHFAEEVRSTRV